MPDTKSAEPTKTTTPTPTPTPKTEEDKDIENQSQDWGTRIKNLIWPSKKK
jgi:hypothetical protein